MPHGACRSPSDRESAGIPVQRIDQLFDRRRGAWGQRDGRTVAEAIRSIAVTEVTDRRWHSEDVCPKDDQVKRLKFLKIENRRLRRAISELPVEKPILNEAASGPEGQRQQNF